jgi:hypothetical protein
MKLVIPHPVGGVQGACGTFGHRSSASRWLGGLRIRLRKTSQTGAEMDLYEHQARQLFEEHGIVVPQAEVTDSPKEAREIARRPRQGGRSSARR